MRKSNPPELLGSVLNAVLSEKGYLSACREAEVVEKWAEIVGERIAKQTECSGVENGVLYVRVPSAPWRQELTSMKRRIITTIPKITHCDTISDIVFC